MEKIEYKDFLGYYYNFYPENYCQHLINEFDRLSSNGAGFNRLESEKTQRHVKDDHQIFLNIRNHPALPFMETDPVNIFFDVLQKCYELYSEKYSILKSTGSIRATQMKMQRTSPGGGYHVWHCEQSNGPPAYRVLTYILYLNSLEENDGGETEFLYQKTRVVPKENLMLLWPAGFTHPHRGNPVLSDKFKYIVTGWFYFD